MHCQYCRVAEAETALLPSHASLRSRKPNRSTFVALRATALKAKGGIPAAPKPGGRGGNQSSARRAATEEVVRPFAARLFCCRASRSSWVVWRKTAHSTGAKESASSDEAALACSIAAKPSAVLQPTLRLKLVRSWTAVPDSAEQEEQRSSDEIEIACSFMQHPGQFELGHGVWLEVIDNNHRACAQPDLKPPCMRMQCGVERDFWGGGGGCSAVHD